MTEQIGYKKTKNLMDLVNSRFDTFVNICAKRGCSRTYVVMEKYGRVTRKTIVNADFGILGEILFR